jgi:crotonobetainyl-CoA:carnitine CoA-transferase CaiB-like acyl-CoA transferase
MTSAAVKGRGLLQEFTSPVVGAVNVTRAPFRFSDAKVEIPRPAPGLGEHNREVLGELLGYSEAKIASLLEDGLLVGEPTAPTPTKNI